MKGLEYNVEEDKLYCNTCRHQYIKEDQFASSCNCWCHTWK